MNLPELRKDSADKLTQFKPEQIAALQRAAERARLIAEQTGTKLVVAVPPQTPSATVNRVNTVGGGASEN